MKRVLVYGMTDNPGGIESYLMFMLEKMRSYNIQFDFVTDFPDIAYKSVIEKEGCRVYYIPAKGKKLFKHWAGIKKILKEHPEYDTVYFNILDAGGVFSAIIPKLMGRKVITHSHNGDTDKVALHRLCKPLMSMITDKYVACSRLAANYMFGEKVTNKKEMLIVPNAIEADAFEFDAHTRKVYRELLDLKDRFVVCHVGRITRQKNPYRMIDIFDKVYEQDDSAVLLYVGDGELRDEIIAYIKGKKCADNVRLMGIRRDIKEIMQASDVFLLPSLYEGFPIVAVEAQAASLPIVLSTNITEEIKITDNIAFEELVRDDNVWACRILEFKNFCRVSSKQQIINAGYDKNSMSKVFDIFAKMIKE